MTNSKNTIGFTVKEYIGIGIINTKAFKNYRPTFRLTYQHYFGDNLKCKICGLSYINKEEQIYYTFDGNYSCEEFRIRKMIT